MRSKFFIFCVVLLIVALFATIYLYTNRELKSKKTGETIKSITLPPKVAVELVSDRNGLKKYRNNVEKYEITIPNTWKISQESLSGEGLVSITPSNQIALGLNGSEISINTSQDTIDSLSTFNKLYVEKELDYKTRERAFKISNKLVDGEKAVVHVKRTLPGDPTESSYQIITWIRPTSERSSYANLFVTLLTNSVDETLRNLDSYNQIISSLRFF